jgi:pSer/pThr/pTyr-binding forkhead associated (FHA) protein
VLADLGSVNRTYLNGTAVDGEVELRHGDRIEIGGLTLEFIQLLPEQPAEPKPAEKLTVVMPEPVKMPSLVVSGGAQKGVRFALRLDAAVIGRAGGSGEWDIVLTDRGVSRPHAKVERTGQGFLLTDLGSANGTRINGVQLTEPHLLQDGDAVLIGETILIFHQGVG